MGFGLNITENIPIASDKTDWVNYNGIMMPKNKARALKAWDTMRAEQKNKSYDRINKNKVRNEIIKIIKTNLPIKSQILTMETKDFLFVKQALDYRFFICEVNIKTYIKMFNEYNKNKELRTSIYFLHHGSIAEMMHLIPTYDVVFLDFSCTFEKAKESISTLLKAIYESRYFGFTFCLRKNKKELNDYKFDLISKIEKLLLSYPEGWRIRGKPIEKERADKIKIISNLIYGEAYRDNNHAPMITLFYKNLSNNANCILEKYG